MTFLFAAATRSSLVQLIQKKVIGMPGRAPHHGLDGIVVRATRRLCLVTTNLVSRPSLANLSS
jgi:hypothetical protein